MRHIPVGPDESERAKEDLFSKALEKLLSVPRAEVERRIKSAPKESASRHTRYKIVPGVPAPKP